jgi:putative transcriptional regulator
MSGIKSLQGNLILDSGKLVGSYFDRTVILICRHDESGTMGLVLNRPLQDSLNTMAPDIFDPDFVNVAVYSGGPVNAALLSYLLETKEKSGDHIFPKLKFGNSLAELKSELEGAEKPLRVRTYAGYAGWEPGQLDREMKEGCWVKHPGSLLSVFNKKPEIMWKEILSAKGGMFRLIAQAPEDILLN